MYFALIAVILFSLSQPMAKLILSQGASSYIFAFIFVFLRLLFTLPMIKFNCKFPHLHLIVGLGVAGAALQLLEFYALSTNLSVALVGYLIFSLPLWTTLFGTIINRERLNHLGFFRVGLVLLGVGVIVQNQLSSNVSVLELVAPLGAGAAMGLWVSLSRRMANQSVSPATSSFIYDLATLSVMTPIIFISHPTEELRAAFNWFTDLRNFVVMTSFTAIFGLIANLAFYQAAKQVSSMQLGITMTLEPVGAALASFLLFSETYSSTVIAGFALITFANIPISILHMLTLKIAFLRKKEVQA